LAARLEAIRVEAAERMGVRGSDAVPKIAVVAPPAPFRGLDRRDYAAGDADVLARVISMGTCHRAFALTSAMCLGVAARLAGTVVHECLADDGRSPDIRLAHPSGVLPIDATVATRDGQPWAERVTVYRTARRLMEGYVRVP
ncbi:MAG TPA: PrpF domain-containing protein, partial [Methylomirabilota bacterium]|nr:PrpF domain-containing protein [Methylomirabilota bacterium]